MLAAVERYRLEARRFAAEFSARYGVDLDESDVLALIQHESRGNPTAVNAKNGHYSGLGQVGAAAVADFNKANPDSPVEFAWMRRAEHAAEQVRVVAWLLAAGRKAVSGWMLPDQPAATPLWADARYGWGGGNLQTAIARYVVAHGRKPTFGELAAAEPNAGGGNVRPWHHARLVVASAVRDRGEVRGDLPVPFPGNSSVADVGSCCGSCGGVGGARRGADFDSEKG